MPSERAATESSSLARRLFGIDVRALACFRVAIALVLLFDLAVRTSDLTDHYSDLGVLPRPARITTYEMRGDNDALWWWSLHLAAGRPEFQAALFALAAGAAVCLLVGYRTRLATIVSWALLVSLHARLPVVLNGGDVLLRCLLFWSMFLPLGAAWSVDRAWGPPAPVPRRAFSVATVAVLGQLVAVYWFSVAAKTDPCWTRDGAAVHYALHLDVYATRLGVWLRGHEGLTRFLTHAAYWWEWIGPALAFVPWKNDRFRLAAVAGFWAFHLGLAAGLHIGLFSFVAMAGWLAFLPSSFFDALAARADASRLAPRLESAKRFFPSPASAWFAPGRVASVALAALAILALHHNFRLPFPDRSAAWEPDLAKAAVRLTRLDQEWSMFAPRPALNDGWLVIRGTLADGRTVDLWRPERAISFDKPKHGADEFPNHRWRKYLTGLAWRPDPELLSCLSDWLRQRWNDRALANDPGGRVELVEIFFRVERTPAPGEPFAPIETLPLWRWNYRLGAPPDDAPNAPDLAAPLESSAAGEKAL